MKHSMGRVRGGIAASRAEASVEARSRGISGSPRQHSDLRIVLLDPRHRWVVVDKPAGLLSVPGKGPDKQDCAASRVRELFPHARGPLVVHRLDMDTSGLLVFGLDEEAQRELSRQFENREVEKAYVALVEGVPGTESGVIDAPMRLDVDRRPYQIVDWDEGKSARTRWAVTAIDAERTRLKLWPETGRTHQLRVHCSHMGHPIVGDVLYSSGVEGAGRLMLHAAELTFKDPTNGFEVRALSTPEF